MSHQHDDLDPIEHDPTGMRALLGSLPDPEPMPADLVTRIEAALAQEQRARARGAETADDAVSTGVGLAPVVPLRRRTGFRVLASAAGVVGVLGLGGLILEATTPGGVTAALSTNGSDESSDAGGAAEGAVTQRGSGDPTVLAVSPELRVTVLDGGVAFAASDLADVAAELPSGVELGPAVSDSGGAAAESGPMAPTEPVTSADGARDCATGLGVPATDEVVVGLGVLDGQPAAVLVATSRSGARTAWAVQRSCTLDAPGAIAGPVPVG